MFSDPTTKKPYPKVLIFGRAKSGKTAFCLSAGTPEKPIAIIDTENGTGALASGYRGPGGDLIVPNVKVMKTQDPSMLVKALDWLEGNGNGYAALAVDSATVLWEMAQDAFMSADTGRVKLNEWNLVKMPIKRAYHRLMALPLPSIFSCREKALYRKEGKDLVIAGYVPDFEKGVDYAFDLILQMVEDKGRFYAIVYGSRYYELPTGTRIEDPTWDGIITPIAHRFNVNAPTPVQDDPEIVAAGMYGNDGQPRVTREEILEKVRTARALPHLQNIVRKYNKDAKAGGFKAELDAAYKAKESEFKAPPPESEPHAQPTPVGKAPSPQAEGAGAAVESPAAPAKSEFKGWAKMSFEELLPWVSQFCIGKKKEYLNRFIKAASENDHDGLIHLAMELDPKMANGKEVA